MEVNLSCKGGSSAIDYITESHPFGFNYKGMRCRIQNIGTKVELAYQKYTEERFHMGLLFSNNIFISNDNEYRYCLMHRTFKTFQIITANNKHKLLDVLKLGNDISFECNLFECGNTSRTVNSLVSVINSLQPKELKMPDQEELIGLFNDRDYTNCADSVSKLLLSLSLKCSNRYNRKINPTFTNLVCHIFQDRYARQEKCYQLHICPSCSR